MDMGTHFLERSVIAQKSMKWVQMQKKRYGEKRRGGYVDMGKQVRIHSRIHKSQ